MNHSALDEVNRFILQCFLIEFKKTIFFHAFRMDNFLKDVQERKRIKENASWFTYSIKSGSLLSNDRFFKAVLANKDHYICTTCKKDLTVSHSSRLLKI